jgi:hypothetical protein
MGDMSEVKGVSYSILRNHSLGLKQAQGYEKSGAQSLLHSQLKELPWMGLVLFSVILSSDKLSD